MPIVQHSETRSTTATDPKSYAGKRTSSQCIAGRQPCSCGYCETVAVGEAVDAYTGDVGPLERPSRAVLCPQCGGYNEAMRRRRVAHVAAWTRRHNVHKSALKFVTVTVERDVRKELESYQQSYQFLTGCRGAYDKALRRLRYRDEDMQFAGIVAARPSDGLAHFHLLIASNLSSDALHKALHVAGLDVDVKTPQPTDSADDFAACAAHYLFVNAVRAAAVDGSFRFTASRGSGLGYHSKAARADRMAYVKRQRKRHQRPSEQPSEQSAEGRAQRPPACPRGSIASNVENQKRESRSAAEKCPSGEGEHAAKVPEAQRPPPIRGDGELCRTDAEVESAVQAMLRARQGSIVWVPGVGVARLIHWQRYPRCTVHVQASNVSRLVHWQELEVEDAPRLIVETTTKHSSTADMSKQADRNDNSQQDKRSAYDRLHDRLSPRYSRVTMDGHTTIQDHQTGEMWVEGDRGYPHRSGQS